MEKRENPKTRLVRVFISSTFRDMQAERDRLVKFIFPELRRRCRERQVEFVEVDLRWGVTEEQAERGEVLPICLAEIENCRPYFIGLLGERYGFVPKEIPEELVETQPWLEEHRERSLTELEILHGVLRNPQMAPRAFFYFRDPSYRDRVPTEQVADLISESAEARAKLKVLKDRIRKSGLHLREDYADPKALGELILEDLWRVIDEEYPAGSEPDPLDREAAEHEAFAEARRKVYIGRQEYFDRLDEHVRSDGPPLVILGESGVGKSALLANWAKRHREAHPEDFVLLHFTGSTPYSADYVAILRRIFGEIKRQFAVSQEIPNTPEELREEFPQWLAMASATEKRFVLVLDGLNQLEDRDAAPHLGWLPEYFPPNVRGIVSALPGPSVDATERRGWPNLRVELFQPEERHSLIRDYLSQYRKTLDTNRTERIAAAPQTANPLYLRTFLEELRIFGIHEELNRRVDHYLAAQTVGELYQKILERWEQDYERDRFGLVRDVMSFLWASRRGLTESEVLDLLGRGEQPLPAAHWAPLSLAAEQALITRSGLLSFAHDFLRQAVRDRYLSHDDVQRAEHRRLAEFFGAKQLEKRKTDEYPWQLAEAKDWIGLKDCVTDIGVFLLCEEPDLVRYWLRLEDQFDVVHEYERSLALYEEMRPSSDELLQAMRQVAEFCWALAKYDGASKINRLSLDTAERLFGPEHPHTAKAAHSLAMVLRDMGHYAEAERLYLRALDIREKTGPADDPEIAWTLNHLGMLVSRSGDDARAEELHRRALQIQQKTLGHEHYETAASLNNIGVLLTNRSEYKGAEHMLRQSLSIFEKVLGPNHPDTAANINNLALLLKDSGDLEGAEHLHRRTLAILERGIGPNHPLTATSLGNLAQLLHYKGDYDGAENLLRRALAIWEGVLGPEDPETAKRINNLGALLYEKGDYHGAEPLYQRALAIWEKTLGPEHPHLASCLTNLARILEVKGDFVGAEQLDRRAIEILEGTQEHQGIAKCLSNLAGVLRAKGDCEQAEPLYRRALEIQEEILGSEHPDTLDSLCALAGLRRDMGEHVESARLYMRVLSADHRKESEGEPVPASVLASIAVSAHELAFHTEVPAKEWERAEAHYCRALELFNRLGKAKDATIVELNLQTMFHLSGQLVDVTRVEELTRFLEEAGDPRAEKGRKLLAELASGQSE